jgi:hypothetical protein
MLLLSCINCSFNALQYGNIGMQIGYCPEHGKVLRTPGLTTCGRLFRKDLTFTSAAREQERHELVFTPSAISLLTTRKVVNGGYTSASSADLAPLQGDDVAAVVAQYGELNAKIESLAALKSLPGARAEVALSSLSRTYVRRCFQRDKRWTSGLHLFWWVKERVALEPDLGLHDLRESRALPLDRQIDLAKWSIVMLRLTFLSDVGSCASGTHYRVRIVSNLAEEAASATGYLSLRKLMRWVEREGKRKLDKALPEKTYVRLSRELHNRDG